MGWPSFAPQFQNPAIWGQPPPRTCHMSLAPRDEVLGLAMRVEGRGAPCSQRHPDIQPLPLTLTEQPGALRPWVSH